ncbi:MAG: glycoside hydrolase family 3 C-terminal domain-containing protein [Lachnospiraceae bacterium]|nr:glycoside hydrolase family 3 C-terminal domain-containing protein [Lachnospiraceae bacterium]
MCTVNEVTGLEQELISEITGERIYTPGMQPLARKSAAEGCVLLKNDGTLPLKQGRMVSVFGRCQVDTFYVGYGSGGNVHPPQKVSVLEGLRACEEIQVNEEVASVYEEWCHRKENLADPGKEWGKWPYFYPEMELEEEFVAAAAKKTETAIVIIGRAAGEERENFLGEGSYYLTKEEKRMISLVTSAFEHTVLLLNCGNIIDMSWTKEYEFGAILMMWLGGMETGNAVADILSGKENPSGKLSDTIAVDYESYPSAENFGGQEFNTYEEDIYVGYRYFETFAKDKVLYSFGYGLSYTTFDTLPLSYYGQHDDDYFEVVIRVTNTGKMAGKEVVQLYMEAPQGTLGREKRSLIAFQKTEELAPGKSQDIQFRIPFEQLAAFDDIGKTGYSNTYILEKGEYWYYCGVSGANGQVIYRNAGGTDMKQTRLFRQLKEICPLQQDMERVVPVKENGVLVPGKEVVRKGMTDMKKRIQMSLPEEIPVTGDKGIRFSQVQNEEISVERFVAQLTDEELEALSRGEGGMDRPLGVGGNTGIYGGVLPSLREKGVPAIVTADGPAGLRIKRYTSLMPCGTALACTWNVELIEKLFEKIADELIRFDVDVILSPGLNIHRNPLCGRNFEYFSEDPLISGKMAAAAVRGIQSRGRAGCPKHFACNNQEVNRHHNDSRVSGRALREIYLRGFEICVKESKPKNLMMSYNKVNGVWSHYNYDLARTVLRKEWNFDGVIITDWWMQKSASPEFPELRDNAYRVRACVDVLMPGGVVGSKETEYVSDGTLLETLGNPEGITRAELQKTAINVLNFAAKIDRKR